MDETERRLLEKLRRVEALFAGATTDGEREAAAQARRTIQARIEGLEREDPPVEYRFTLGDAWAVRVFIALCRRYGLEPYRYRGQRTTTLNARVSKRFVDETLWPEFDQVAKLLRQHLNDVTERIIREAIHQDLSDAPTLNSPKALSEERD